MIIPIRCFTCNKVIANKWIAYEKMLEDNVSKDDALTAVGLHRYCCRRMFLSHVDLMDVLLSYQRDEVKEEDLSSEKKVIDKNRNNDLLEDDRTAHRRERKKKGTQI